MKRPLIVFTASFAAMVYIQLQFSPLVFSGSFLLPISVLVFAICVFFCTKRLRVCGVLLLGAALGLLLSAGYTAYLVKPVHALSGKAYTISATVTDYADRYEEEQRVAISIPPDALHLSGPRPRIQTLLYAPLTETPLMPGDTIDAEVHFYMAAASDGFARKEYYASNGIHILARCAQDKETEQVLSFAVEHPKKAPIWTLPSRAAETIRQQASQILQPREAGFLNALLLGDKSGMESADTLALRKSGLSHIASVSGMHMAFLVGFFFLLFGRKYGTILSIFAILFFTPMAGASPSVIRAGIMYLMTAVAFFIGRENDSLNAMCLALLVLLLQNPYAIGSVGLQLSFAAALGLILFSSKLQMFLMRPAARCTGLLRRLLSALTSGLSCSICAMIFTTPIVLMAFGYVSALSLVANLLAVSVVGIIFVGGLAACIFAGFSPALGSALGTMITPLIRYVLEVAHRVADFPYGLVYWGNIYGEIAIIAVYATLVLILVFRKTTKLRLVLPILCGILIAATALGIQSDANMLTITALPSGTGQNIIVAAGRDELTLVDCSASSVFRSAIQNTREWMDWNSYDHIDRLILTAVDKTHARDVPELLESVPVNQIIIPPKVRKTELYDEIIAIAGQKDVPILVWEKAGEQPVSTDDTCGISLIGGVDRKLGVRIASDDANVLILHSMTQKMLASLLNQQPLTADVVVLSESNLTDAALLRDALEDLSPQTILLQSGYSTREKLMRIPVRNTFTEGEVTLQTRRPE